MATAAARGWGNPDGPTLPRKIVSITAGGISVAVHSSVADVFRYLLDRVATTYNLAGYADDWGYANRDIRGHPGVKSNHSWGLAVDLDATKNPMTANLQATHAFVRAVVDPILAPFEERLLWGGEYAGPRKDYMHFEYVGTPADAAADSALARRLLTPPAPTEDEMTPQDWQKLEAMLDDKLRIVERAETKDGKATGHANLRAITSKLDAVMDKLGIKR